MVWVAFVCFTDKQLTRVWQGYLASHTCTDLLFHAHWAVQNALDGAVLMKPRHNSGDLQSW